MINAVRFKYAEPKQRRKFYHLAWFLLDQLPTGLYPDFDSIFAINILHGLQSERSRQDHVPEQGLSRSCSFGWNKGSRR